MQKNLENAVLELNNNGVVAIPTETVYGLAGNAFSEEAVKKVFDLKKRPSNNPLILHIGSLELLKHVAREISQPAYQLAHAFWPGPLTLVLKKHRSIPDRVTSGLDTVGVRVPNHPLTLELLDRLDFPLAAPSANPFGSISPTNPDHVRNYFKNELSVLEGGECEKGIESTILGFDEKGRPVLYRHGSIALEEIEKVIGKVRITNHDDIRPHAPGMLSRHYAPATDAFLTKDVPGMMGFFPNSRIGLLLFKERIEDEKNVHQEVLSASGNFKEAAKNLYSALHRLDRKDLDVILIEQLPEIDLGISINDKLRRATKKKPEEWDKTTSRISPTPGEN